MANVAPTSSFTGGQQWLVKIQQGRELERISQKPILAPARRDAIESRGVLNPAVVEIDSQLLMVYRAEGRDGASRLRSATSSDGISWSRNGMLLDKPAEHLQLEDPRLTKTSDGRVIMTCTEANMREKVAKIAIYERAGNTFERIGEVDKEHEKASDKDGALFPERIGGEYKMLRRPWPNIEIASSKELSGPWTTQTKGFIAPREGMWDNGWVGGGAPPILTDKGWFILYHGADTDRVYRLGADLVEKDNPSKVLWRSDRPLLEPKLAWEINGVVSKVVFACAAIERSGNLWVWYGGADFAIGAAML